jgi:hypothetical protein
MRYPSIILLSVLLGAGPAFAQVSLNDFSDLDSSGTVFGDWAGQQNPGTYSVTGTTSDDSGLELYSFDPSGFWDLTGLTALSLTAQADPGNEAATFLISLYDANDNSATAYFESSTFAGASLVTGVSTLTYSDGFDPASVGYFRISGGEFFGSTPLALTFDQVTAQSASAVPEPATYAALLGLLALAGTLGWRHRQIRHRVL